MIAAIYVRKSPVASEVAEDAKSVTRQVENARAYATRKGWSVADDLVFVDDNISGAEFESRPGYVRLLNSLKPRPRFNVLVMSEKSRLGREQIEVSYAVKQLVQAGVRIFLYLGDEELVLDSPTDKLLLSVSAYADEIERERSRQRTYDALARKAKAGYVTGGRCFGYSNHEVTVAGPDGTSRRSHVERQVNEAEARVVRRIFELSAGGAGLVAIAKQLNLEGALAPVPQRGRPQTWAPSSVREVLHRPLYHGEIVWNRSRKRDGWGRHKQQDRPPSDWLHVAAPDLQIVPDALWQAVQARHTASRAQYLRGTGGRLHGRPKSGIPSKYLLPGLSRCGVCGAGLYVKYRDQRERHFYGCSSYHYRGACGNGLELPMLAVDTAVIAELKKSILHPGVLDRVIDRAVDIVLATDPAARDADRERITQALARVEQEIARFTAAIGAGGDLASLLEALKAREQQRTALRAQLASLAPTRNYARDATAWRLAARTQVKDWRGCLERNTQEARRVLSTLVDGPIRFMPLPERDGWRFEARGTIEPLLSGFALMVASPAGVEPASPP